MSTREVFTKIYEESMWDNEESASGRGSTLEATAALRTQLPGLLESLGVRTLLDAPCGDFYWMARTDLKLDHYIGGDIVDELIAALINRFDAPGRSFIALDIIADPLPKADAFLCRDCMIHLPIADVQRVIANAVSSDTRWMLANTYPETRVNVDIVTGMSRPLNLTQAPFFLPEPLAFIDEGDREGNRKHLAVWDLRELRQR